MTQKLNFSYIRHIDGVICREYELVLLFVINCTMFNSQLCSVSENEVSVRFLINVKTTLMRIEDYK